MILTPRPCYSKLISQLMWCYIFKCIVHKITVVIFDLKKSDELLTFFQQKK